MISPDILDFDALLAPIAGERPTGEDLRADPSAVSVYYQIKDARAAARAAERAGTQFEQGQPIVAPEWRTVLRMAPEILATKSKDLELVAWLTEALVRVHGFAGLRDGFRLARELVERYWDDLYPMPDEDGISTRVAPMVGLNGGESEGTLAVPIALAPITADGDFGVFGLWRYAKAREQARSEEPPADGGVATMEQFESAVRSTPPEFFRCLLGDVEATLEHFTALAAMLDERCGSESPPSSALRNTLQDARQTITHIASDLAGVVASDAGDGGDGADEAETDVAGAPASAQAAAPRVAGELRTRDDAFRMIQKVADWFRDNEPHSPLSSVLYQAVRWGRLPLRQLIEELIPDEGARDHFGLLTGLRGARSSQDDDE